MKNSILLAILVCLCIINKSIAQSSPPNEYVRNTMFWSETILNGKIKGKFKYQFDYQYRRQAWNTDYAGANHNNMFANRFQQVVRPWIHYQATPNIRLSLSPIGWWGTWSAPTGGVVKFTPEYRICPQVTISQKLGRVEISQRYRFEFRFVGVADTAKTLTDFMNDKSYVFNDNNQKGRFRYFLRTVIPLNKKEMVKGTVYLNLFDEVFIGVGKSVGNYNLLDQNRCFAGVGYKFTNNFRCELGYLNQTAFRFNNAAHNNVEQNNIMQLFIIFDDFNALFKKKEKQAPTPIVDPVK